MPVLFTPHRLLLPFIPRVDGVITRVWSRCCLSLLLAALLGLLHPGGEGLSLEVLQLRDLLAKLNPLHQILEQEVIMKEEEQIKNFRRDMRKSRRKYVFSPWRSC